MVRERIQERIETGINRKTDDDNYACKHNSMAGLLEGGSSYHYPIRKTIGFTKCSCNAPFKGAVVLDPFCGAGTTWVALKKYKPNAKFIGFELKKEYIDMAYLRVGKRLSSGPLLEFVK
jgi:DNA modification methylase